jgi:hypothetical protein
MDFEGDAHVLVAIFLSKTNNRKTGNLISKLTKLLLTLKKPLTMLTGTLFRTL